MFFSFVFFIWESVESGDIYVISFLVFHTKVTVNVGLKRGSQNGNIHSIDKMSMLQVWAYKIIFSLSPPTQAKMRHQITPIVIITTGDSRPYKTQTKNDKIMMIALTTI